MNAVEIKNLKKHFGRVKAVDDISLDVIEGEIFGFLGPNGAGKSTTIRCMMDFYNPTSGKIKILGLDSKKDSVRIKEKIGYLPADVRLYDGWTGKEHIDLLEKIHHRKSNALELVKKLDFNTKIKFKNLSTGNKRKLGLILALMFDPQLIILDEPTAGLDPILQNVVYEILEAAQKKGSTVFMSSHNLIEVERICHHVAIIRNGKIVAVEDIQNLKNKRMHIATIRFAAKPHKKEFTFDGVEIQQELPDGFILNIKGDINPIMTRLAKFSIRDLEITHASLEEVFLEFYK